MKYCSHCGNELLDEAVICPKCGCAVDGATRSTPVDTRPSSAKSRGIALILAVFLGGIGVHRFYVGKIGTGILWLFTGGCFGIGALIDIIMIACGSFTDKAGLPLLHWDMN